MGRKAMKDITLSDGTRIPKGTFVNAPAYAMHHDDAHLEHADTFDPFRFARMRSVEGQSAKHQLTSTSPEYIPFGHGQHAWYVSPITPPGSVQQRCDTQNTVSIQSREIFRFERAEGDPGVHHPQLRPEARGRGVAPAEHLRFNGRRARPARSRSFQKTRGFYPTGLRLGRRDVRVDGRLSGMLRQPLDNAGSNFLNLRARSRSQGG